jgi:hypothetical protein
VTLNGATTLTPSFIAPAGPASVTFSLTAITAAGASISLSRTIAVLADGVVITTAVWDNRQGTGKLNVVANTSAFFSGVPAAGVSMSMTFWNASIPAGSPGSATNPITAPMNVVSDIAGQPPVCGTALPCLVANLTSVIADPNAKTAAKAFVVPTTITVKSSLGGTASLTGPAIKIR